MHKSTTLHGLSLRSPCATTSVDWSGVKLAAIRLWSSENLFSVLATGYDDILDHSVIPTLWQQFGEGPFLFQHNNAPMHKTRFIQNGLSESVSKNLTGLHRTLSSTPSNTFGMNWNADCEPGVIAKHQCPTSLMLSWLNGSEFPQQCSNI
jgi:hypothetical protein